MGRRSSTTSRLQRLERLKAHLKSGDAVTAQDIAEEAGVSVRTVSRDIALLRRQGLPIDADRGRGGGLRLHHTWGVGRVKLSYTEAIDLLVSLAVAEQTQSPIFIGQLRSVRRKLIASFSPAFSRRIKSLRARIRVSPLVSTWTPPSMRPPDRRVVERIHHAFFACQRATITYCAVDGSETRRTIEPHYLLFCHPVWYVLAWDDLRTAVRTFRFDRIRRAKTIDDTPFRVLPFGRFSEALEGIESIAT